MPIVPYLSPAELTRPKVSAEEEAEACGLPLNQVLQLREKLDKSKPGPDRQKALNVYVKNMSITATEAAEIFGVPPSYLTQTLRRSEEMVTISFTRVDGAFGKFMLNQGKKKMVQTKISRLREEPELGKLARRSLR